MRVFRLFPLLAAAEARERRRAASVERWAERKAAVTHGQFGLL